MLTKSDLLQILTNKGIDFQIHNHKPLHTVEDSEKLRGNIDGAHTKNLFLKNKKDEFFLFSCDEKAKIDLKRFSKSIGAKNLSFANEFYLQKYLGIKPGSVSALSLLNDETNKVSFYLDENLTKNSVINFHPLVNTATISIKTEELISLIVENKKKINIFSLENYSIVKVYE